MLVLLTLLTAAAAKTPPVEASIRKVQLTDEVRAVSLRVAPNIVTSIRFNRPLDTQRLACGDKQSFLFNVVGDNQIDVKGGTEDTRAATNCNLQTAGGQPILLKLSVTTRDKADAFIDVELPGKAPVATPDGEFTPAQQRLVHDQIYAAVEKAELKATQLLVSLAADGIVSRRINERAVVGDVILVVRDFVKLGSKGIIRFSVDNNSRDSWAAGTVKLWLVAGGQEPISQDVVTVFKQPVADRGEEIFGAITFDMIQLSEGVKFSLQTIEKNGSRHPQVNGIRL